MAEWPIAPVLKTGRPPATTSNASVTSDNPENDLASCLALLARKSADLALLVARWDALPEAVRAGILAMVKAASGPGNNPNRVV
jgi:hypothetical protein